MLSSLLGYTVIAERYIPDFLVWVVITTDDSSYLSSISARFLLALALRAKAKIYVKADLQKLIESSQLSYSLSTHQRQSALPRGEGSI
jgi:hypothetical protein